jgi:hypothetical protein
MKAKLHLQRCEGMKRADLSLLSRLLKNNCICSRYVDTETLVAFYLDLLLPTLAKLVLLFVVAFG